MRAPFLPDLAAGFDALPVADQDRLYTQVAELEASLRTRILARRPASQPDRVLGLDEAAAMLSMSRAWLERKANWQRIPGAYRDQDRRVKFPLSALEAYIRRQTS